MLPEGCLRARIRGTKRETSNAQEGTLADTLGEESHGLIVVDRGGIPMKYTNLTLYEQIVASEHPRIAMDVPGDGGPGWSSTGDALDPANDPALGADWRRHIQAGAEHLREETYVRFERARKCKRKGSASLKQ